MYCFSQQEILRTQYLTQDLPGQVDGLRACGMMEVKIMKNYVLSWSIGKILAEDQGRAELLYGYTITRTSEKAGS